MSPTSAGGSTEERWQNAPADVKGWKWCPSAKRARRIFLLVTLSSGVPSFLAGIGAFARGQAAHDGSYITWGLVLLIVGLFLLLTFGLFTHHFHRNGDPVLANGIPGLWQTLPESRRLIGSDGSVVPPSEAEVDAYARHLGIDPVEDKNLLWIAAQALTAKLPRGWGEFFDEDGFPYFYNHKKGISQWEHPLEDHYRELYHHMKAQGARPQRRRRQRQRKRWQRRAADVASKLLPNARLLRNSSLPDPYIPPADDSDSDSDPDDRRDLEAASPVRPTVVVPPGLARRDRSTPCTPTSLAAATLSPANADRQERSRLRDRDREPSGGTLLVPRRIRRGDAADNDASDGSGIQTPRSHPHTPASSGPATAAASRSGSTLALRGPHPPDYAPTITLNMEPLDVP